MKKTLAILLALTMIACFIPAFAVASSAAAPVITVDGEIGDWDGIDTLSIVGEGDSTGKSVTFYAYLAEDGLYLAADAIHSTLTTNKGNWWENTNFEIFIDNLDGNRGRTQYWANIVDGTDGPVANKSDNVGTSAFTTEETGNFHHTIIEAFIPTDNLPEAQRGKDYVTLGCAWKTVGDTIKGGAGNEYDEYWVLVKTWPDQCQLVATNSGIYRGNDVWEIKDGTAKCTARTGWPDFVTYILGESSEAVTIEAELVIGNTGIELMNNGGDYGFLFAVTDNNGDGIIAEDGDFYYLVDLQSNGVIGIHRNNGGWNPDGWGAEYQTNLSQGTTVKLTVTYNAGNIKVYINDGEEPVIDYTDTNTAILSGTSYALASKVTNAVYTNLTVNGVAPENHDLPITNYDASAPGDGAGGDDAGGNPGTGDVAAIVIAAAAVMSLAGAAVVATKRNRI